MSVLERAKSHFASRRTLECIEVPEWDAKVYYYPAMTVEEMKSIADYISGDRVDLEGCVSMLITRARNEDGSRMFTPASRLDLLRHVDGNVVTRVAGAMRLEFPTIEEAEGN